MKLSNIACALFSTILLSACGQHDTSAGKDALKFAPPSAVSAPAPGGREVMLKVVLQSDSGYSPDPGMYWVFTADEFHVEVNKSVTQGRLWKNRAPLADLVCREISYRSIECSANASDGNSYLFRAIMAADYPRLFPNPFLTVTPASVWPPVHRDPVQGERHLNSMDYNTMFQAMAQAASAETAAGRKPACSTLTEVSLKIFTEKGFIYPVPNDDDRLSVTLAANLLGGYPTYLCY